MKPQEDHKLFVYIFHFERPFHHARHYVGCTKNIAARYAYHLSGRGAKILKAVLEAGIGIRLVKIIEGGYDLEKKIKASKNTARYCPVCQLEKMNRKREESQIEPIRRSA